MNVYSHTTGFTRGEVEASLYDRFDVDFYRAASELVDNWFPDVAGAIERRPGFVPLGSSSPTLVRQRPDGIPEGVDCGEFVLRSFVFRQQVFLLLFRRVCTPGYQTVTLTTYRMDGETPVLQLEDEYLVYYSDASTDLAALLSPDLPPDSGDGSVPVEFSSNLAQNICLAQVGPAVFVASRLFPPYRIFVDSNNETQLERVQFFEELLGTVDINNGSGSWTGEDTLFQDQLADGDKFYFDGVEYTVTARSSQTAMTATPAYSGLSLSGERITIKTGVFDTDWPRLCTFHKGRLFLFSTPEKPVGMWASRSSDPFTVVPGSAYDDAPIEVELLTEGAEEFVWVRAAEQLFLGGGQAEYIVDALSDRGLTPTGFSFYRVSSNGGAPLQPFNTDASTVFVNRGRNRLTSVRFDEARAGYVGADLSLLAPHLLADGVRDFVYRPGTRNDRTARVFIHLDTKELRTCTLAEEENVIAWSRINTSNGYEVQAVATSPDDVFAVVKCPSGALVLAALDVDNTSPFVLDMEWDYEATAGVATLDPIHQGTTVAVLAGSQFLGFFETTETLDIGDDMFNNTLTVGIPFTSLLRMLPVVLAETQDGGTLNRKHRLVRVLLAVEEAYELSINEEPMFGTVATNVVSGFPKRAGTYERRFLGWGERPETEIAATSIYRAKIRSITREVSL